MKIQMGRRNPKYEEEMLNVEEKIQLRRRKLKFGEETTNGEEKIQMPRRKPQPWRRKPTWDVPTFIPPPPHPSEEFLGRSWGG